MTASLACTMAEIGCVEKLCHLNAPGQAGRVGWVLLMDTNICIGVISYAQPKHARISCFVRERDTPLF